ncbi:MAG: HupE/UreJ family protein [Chthoniobacterales bacterium]
MKKIPLLAFALLAVPTLAHAHAGHSHSGGFAPGLLHPIYGLDHLLAMLAIGLWATQLGGRALWATPVAFLSAIALGGLLGANGLALPLIEPGILASVLTLGLLLAFAVRLPLVATLLLVGFFGLFHGSAHAVEMPAGASALPYAGGFLLTTGAITCGAIVLGSAISRFATIKALRPLGASIAIAGAALVFL